MDRRHAKRGSTALLYARETLDTQVNRICAHCKQRIQDNWDIVDHHIMVGVPWEEALQGLRYHPNVDADLTARVQMLQPVYTGIKAQHPSLPVMVSIAFKSPGSAEMATIAAGFERIRDYVDSACTTKICELAPH